MHPESAPLTLAASTGSPKLVRPGLDDLAPPFQERLEGLSNGARTTYRALLFNCEANPHRACFAGLEAISAARWKLARRKHFAARTLSLHLADLEAAGLLVRFELFGRNSRVLPVRFLLAWYPATGEMVGASMEVNLLLAGGAEAAAGVKIPGPLRNPKKRRLGRHLIPLGNLRRPLRRRQNKIKLHARTLALAVAARGFLELEGHARFSVSNSVAHRRRRSGRSSAPPPASPPGQYRSGTGKRADAGLPPSKLSPTVPRRRRPSRTGGREAAGGRT